MIKAYPENFKQEKKILEEDICNTKTVTTLYLTLHLIYNYKNIVLFCPMLFKVSYITLYYLNIEKYYYMCN